MPKRRSTGAERYFAKRAGRKHNPNAKRHATTREGQGRDVLPPVEPLMRRLELVGVRVTPRDPLAGPMATADLRRHLGQLLRDHGIATVAAEDTLGVLLAAGRLRHGDEDHGLALERHQAGARFAWLHWYELGRPFARAADLQVASEPPEPPKLPPELLDLDSEGRRLYFAHWLRLLQAALARTGRHVQAVVRRCVVHCEMPLPAQLGALRRGLDVLARVAAPRVADLPALTRAEIA